jgi:hypothetical protein
VTPVTALASIGIDAGGISSAAKDYPQITQMTQMRKTKDSTITFGNKTITSETHSTR